VMPTGGGKSMLFMLPSSVEQDGVTVVVVVPLVALREDIQRQCDELGIKCAAWNWRRPQRTRPLCW
jgi:superfamily II DNA helicase RecQ